MSPAAANLLLALAASAALHGLVWTALRFGFVPDPPPTQPALARLVVGLVLPPLPSAKLAAERPTLRARPGRARGIRPAPSRPATVSSGMLSGGQPLREASDGHGGPPQGRGAGGALPSPWTRRWLGAEGLLDRPDSPLIAALCETDIDWCRRLEMLLAHAPGFVARIDCRTAREREDGADRLAARVLIVHRASSAAEPTLVHPSSNPAFDRMALAQAELIARQAQRLVQKGGAQRSVWTFEDDSPRAARLTLEAVMGELIP